MDEKTWMRSGLRDRKHDKEMDRNGENNIYKLVVQQQRHKEKKTKKKKQQNENTTNIHTSNMVGTYEMVWTTGQWTKYTRILL